MNGSAALLVGALGTLVAPLGVRQPQQQFPGPEQFPGQHLTHHPVHLGPGDPGIRLTGVCKNEIIATNRPATPGFPPTVGMTEWAR